MFEQLEKELYIAFCVVLPLVKNLGQRGGSVRFN